MKPGFIVHAYNLRTWEVPEEGLGFHTLSLCSVFHVMSHPWIHKEFKASLGYMNLCLKMNKQNQRNKKWDWEGGSVAKSSGAFPGTWVQLSALTRWLTPSPAVVPRKLIPSSYLPGHQACMKVHGHTCKQDTHTHKIFLFTFKIKTPKAKHQNQSNHPHKLKW